MALFVDLVALSNGLHGSVQMDSVALFSWIGWLRHRGILTSGIFGIAIKYLKKNEHPIVVILLATIAEDLIINLLCDIKFITYIIQIVLIIIFALYTKYKNKNVAY